jgi:Carbohydrate esterase, sialic acid-specific acetylesterase/Secretion system C-terminal sorting domain
MKRIFVVLGIFLICFGSISAQVTYFQKPMSMQLFPRDASDSAEVKISGVVAQQGMQAAIFKLYRNGILLDSTTNVLNYQNSVATFENVYKIKAEKSEYKVNFSLFDGITENCILTADSLVAGDVFVVNGQSNGAAPNQGTGAIENDEWVRTFGTSSYSSIDCAKDTLWGLGLGKATQSNLAIGVWSIKLAKMLSDSLQIPVCIINGSRYGTRIISHLPNPNNHLDLATIYGRLLFRVNKAGVINNIKGLFWYQGESDCDTAYVSYASRFNLLYNSWKMDFPGCNRLFVMQTRPGCVVGTYYLFHQQLREIQRSLEFQYSDITLMSTNAIPNFDGCHFLSTGYNVLATQLYFQVLRDIYGQSIVANIDPPKILNASFVDSSNTLLAINMSQDVIWPGLYNGRNVKDYFYFDNPGLTVSTGWTSKDTIYLQLTSPSLTSRLSYLPGVYYNNSTQIYMGPWLTNSKSIGALTFNQFNVSHQINIAAQGPTLLCNGDSVLLTADKNALSFQWFKNGVALLDAIKNSLWVKNEGDYSLSMSDTLGNQVQSNTIQITSGALPVSIVTTGNSICKDESTLLSVNTNASFLWSNGSNQSSISVGDAGWYSVTAVDAVGCVSVDSIQVIVHPKPLANLMHFSLSICDGDSTILYLENAETGLWSNGTLDSFIYPKHSGYYSALVTNSFGCTAATDTVYVDVINTPISVVSSGPLSTCANQKIILSLNNYIGTNYQWSNSGTFIQGATTSNYMPTESGSYSLSLVDSFGCLAISPPVMVTIHRVPASKYTLSNQFDTCIDSLVTLTANNGVGLTYQWQRNGITLPGINSRVLNTQQAGNYAVVVTNAFGCSKLSTLTAIPVSNPSATIQLNGNSVICIGDSVRLSASTGVGYTYQWMKNNVLIPGATTDFYFAKQKGFYKVRITNANSCSATSSGKSIMVGDCNITSRLSSDSDVDLDQISVYPNPFTNSLKIAFENPIEHLRWSLVDITGRICLQGEMEANQPYMELQGLELQHGMYFLVLESPSAKRMIKIQKVD